MLMLLLCCCIVVVVVVVVVVGTKGETGAVGNFEHLVEPEAVMLVQYILLVQKNSS